MNSKFQKVITYFLVKIMIINVVFSGTLCGGTVISHAATPSQMANVVIFVDFQNTDHSTHNNNSLGECFLHNYQTTLDLFDGSDAVNTGMARYLDAISYGQFKQVNIFPQYDEKTGKITPFKVEKNASAYVDINSSDLLSEVLVQLENANLIDDKTDMDLNDDGLIDNVTMVVAFTEKTSDGGDVFTSHKSNYGGTETVNGLRAGSYNLVTESGGYLGLQKSGLMIHEFMHSLGYPDLYKVGAVDNSANPVGGWDIMASNSYRLQYPLAYLRSHYTNWFTIPTITNDVTDYSIYAASATTIATKNNQALILKTDYSDSEFFVVEYRRGNDEYLSTEYDAHIYGSGLIVYRVNTRQEKNIAGETDLIYIFRPGDTYDSYGHEAGGGDLTNSFLSAESGRTSYGSADYQATLSDGAITYSDGTNSGIVISNVGSASGDTISFNVTFGDGGEALGGFWNTETEKSVGNLSTIDSVMDEEGNIYVVTGLSGYTTSGNYGSFEVYKYNHTVGWNKLGTTVNVNGGYHKILLCDNKPYVVCTDYGNNRINLYGYSDNSDWIREFRSIHEGDEFDVVAHNGNIYIAYTMPYSYGSASSVYCESYSVSTGMETDYGVVTTGEYLCNPYVGIYDGSPVVVTRDVFGGNIIATRKYLEDTDNWVSVADELRADTFCGQLCGDTLYLMKNGDGNGNYESSYVYALDLTQSDSDWTQLGTNAFIDNSAVPMSMFFYDGAMYITYQNGDINSQDVYVKTLVDNKWEPVGTKVTRDGILGMSGHVYNNTVYLVYGNNTSGITIKIHEYAEDADQVGGDTSGDDNKEDVDNPEDTGGDNGKEDVDNPGNTGSDENIEDTEKPENTDSDDNKEDSTESEVPGGVVEEIFVAPEIKVSYRTHIQTFGWEGVVNDIKTWKSNGTMSGTSGKAKRLEGINIVVDSADSKVDLDLGIQYTTHCQSYGWLPWSANGEMNGTEGEAKRLEAIMIKLTGADAKYYDVYYRVHAQSYGWLGWASNGASAGTAGYGKRLEGIQIVVVKKGESFNQKMENIESKESKAFVAKEGNSPIVNYPATSNTNPVVPGADTVNVAYRTHVQSFGWQGWKYNGQMSGTSGKAKRLEGINIELRNQTYSGDIVYTTHVQSYGWQGSETDQTKWFKNGDMAGTSGEAKRLEAICINLTGEMSQKYDVYYRVHAQSYGWLGWAKNGAPAGTAGYGKRLEGIQIVLVPKGGTNPKNYQGITSDKTEAYISK